MARFLLTIAFLGFCAALLSSTDGTKAHAKPISMDVQPELEYAKKLKKALPQLPQESEYTNGGRKLMQTAREQNQLVFVASISNGDRTLFEQGLVIFEGDLDFEIQVPDSDLTLTPLEAAIVRDNVPFAAALIRAGADPNTKSSATPDTPLYLAIVFASGDMVSLLVEAGADIDERRDNRTPLSFAFFLGKFDAVAVLEDAGATIVVPRFEGDGRARTADEFDCGCTKIDPENLGGFVDFCEFEVCAERG